VTRKIHKTDGILKGWWKIIDVSYVFNSLSLEWDTTVTRQHILWAVHLIINLNFVCQLPVRCGLLNMSMIVSLQSEWCPVLIVLVSRSNTTETIARDADLFPYSISRLTDWNFTPWYTYSWLMPGSKLIRTVTGHIIKITTGNQVRAG